MISDDASSCDLSNISVSELILNETANSLYKSYHNPTSKSVEFIKYIDEQDYIRKFDKLFTELYETALVYVLYC